MSGREERERERERENKGMLVRRNVMQYNENHEEGIEWKKRGSRKGGRRRRRSERKDPGDPMSGSSSLFTGKKKRRKLLPPDRMAIDSLPFPPVNFCCFVLGDGGEENRVS